MKNAHASKPKRDFNKPKDAVYVTVHGVEEAFKPGTEPHYDYTPDEEGPKPYLNTWKGDEDEAPPAAPTDEAPPPAKKNPEDLY